MIDSTLTEFQVWSGDEHDYTEARLTELILKEENPLKILPLIALRYQYKRRELAIAWKKGEPVYVYVYDEYSKICE